MARNMDITWKLDLCKGFVGLALERILDSGLRMHVSDLVTASLPSTPFVCEAG